jgi:hypothetical protein
MTGPRQLRTGITLLLLSLVVPMSALVLSRPTAGWEAATLVATALLVAVCARRTVVVPRLSAVARAVTGPSASDLLLAAARLSPDAPGRPEQPRAPGRAAVARRC